MASRTAMRAVSGQGSAAERTGPLRSYRWLEPSPARCWAALAASIAVYAFASSLMGQPFHESVRSLRFFDLSVYRAAARRMATGTAVYATPIREGLGFTYPPFAALVMRPLAWVSLRVDELLVTGVNVGFLVWVMRRTLRLAPPAAVGGDRAERPALGPWSMAAVCAAAAVWCEPINVTLGYGQINLLITALIVGDLTRPDRARTKGAGIGLAAALKLTPLMFIPYLLLSGRRRAAAVAASTFAASVALAYALVPGEARAFWGQHLFLNSSRVGAVADTANQSLRGALARLTGHSSLGLGAGMLIGAVAILGLGLAVRYSRRGDEAAGFSLAALTALLISPISWTHHWTLAVPALVLLGIRAQRQRSPALRKAFVALILLGYSYAPEYAGAAIHGSGLGTLVTSDPYALAAIAVLLTAAVRTAGTMRAHRVQAG